MKRIILILFLITSQIWATNYYIDPAHPSASNSNAGTAPGSPWADQEAIHNNWSNFTGGDVIYIAEGARLDPASSTRIGIIQVPNNYQNGSRYNKIKFTSYIGYGGAGAKPVVSNKRIGSGYYQPLRIGAAAYLEFENIRFESFYGENVVMYPHYGGYGNGTVGVHDIIFRNCEFETGNFKVVRSVQGISGPESYVPDMDAQNANTAPVYRIWMIDGLFEATRAEDAMSFPNGNRGRSDGSGLVAAGDTNIFVHGTVFYDTQEEAIDIAGGSDHLIEYNYVSGTFGGSTNGMKFHSQCAPFEYSTIRYNTASGIFYTFPYYNKTDWANNGSVIGASSYGLVLWNVQNCEVYNNTMYNVYAMIMGDDERTDQTAYWRTTENNTVKNNNLYGCFGIAGDGDVIQGGWTHNQEDSLTILNTFSNNNYHTNAQFNDWRLVRVTRNSAPQEALCLSDDGNPVGGSLGEWTDIWINGKYAQSGKGELNVVPDLVSPTWTGVYGSHDHSLNATSPLIDAGTSFSSTLFPEENVDLAGNTRISGTAPDIGAYEYQAGDTPGQLTFSPESISMGTVATSETETATLTINNIGTTDSVIISAVTLTGDSSSLFTINDIYVVVTGIQASVSTPYELEAGSTMYVEVQFDGSTATGTKSCNLSIDHDSNVMANDPWLIPVSVTGSDASVVFSISGDSTKTFTSPKGSEQVVNYSLTDWSSDDPDGFTVIGEDGSAPSDDQVTESSSGVANLISSGDYVALKQYGIMSIGQIQIYEIDLDAVSDGSVKFENNTEIIDTWTASDVGIIKGWFNAVSTQFAFARGSSSGNTDAEVNYISIKQLTSGSWNATATITATGNLTCDDIQLLDGTDFSITSATSFSLSDSETFDLTYSFTPSDTGYFQDTIRLSGINASNVSTYDIPIDGYFESDIVVGSEPRINLEFADIFYPDTDTSATSDTTFDLWNDGDALLTIDSITLSSDQFTLNYPDGSGDTTLTAGDTLLVDVSFEPTTTGVKPAYLRIYHDGVNIGSPATVQLQGTATAISTPAYMTFLNPTGDTLDFGSVTVGTEGYITKNVIWQNDGSTTLSGTMDLSDSTLFTHISGSFTISTAQDTRDTVSFRFEPTSAGTFYDSLVFNDNSDNYTSPYKRYFKGVGLSTAQNYEIDKTSYYFGVQDTSDADTVTFTITNSGGAALGDSIVMASSEQFTLLNGGAFSTGGQKQFSVIAQPTDEMYYEIEVYVYHNATNATSPDTITVNVTGNVPSRLAVIPSNYHFGTVFLGDDQESSDIIAYNKGRDTITVDSIYLATNSVFTIPDTLSASLPGNLILNGGFDKDTLWSGVGIDISDNNLEFISSPYSASYNVYGLGLNAAYLLVMDVSSHSASGDNIQINLAGETTTISSSNYNNGTLAILLQSGGEDIYGSYAQLTISLYGGNYSTVFDNITLSKYITRKITFTPIAGTSFNTDILYYEHDGNNTNPFPVPISGYMNSGNLTMPGNIRHED